MYFIPIVFVTVLCQDLSNTNFQPSEDFRTVDRFHHGKWSVEIQVYVRIHLVCRMTRNKGRKEGFLLNRPKPSKISSPTAGCCEQRGFLHGYPLIWNMKSFRMSCLWFVYTVLTRADVFSSSLTDSWRVKVPKYAVKDASRYLQNLWKKLVNNNFFRGVELARRRNTNNQPRMA